MRRICKALSLLLLFALIAGCATWNQRESTVTLPTGEVYSVRCQPDAQVHYKDGKVDLTVNNQGRPGYLDQVLGATMLGVAGASATAGNLLKEAK